MSFPVPAHYNCKRWSTEPFKWAVDSWPKLDSPLMAHDTGRHSLNLGKEKRCTLFPGPVILRNPICNCDLKGKLSDLDPKEHKETWCWWCFKHWNHVFVVVYASLDCIVFWKFESIFLEKSFTGLNFSSSLFPSHFLIVHWNMKHFLTLGWFKGHWFPSPKSFSELCTELEGFSTPVSGVTLKDLFGVFHWIISLGPDLHAAKSCCSDDRIELDVKMRRLSWTHMKHTPCGCLVVWWSGIFFLTSRCGMFPPCQIEVFFGIRKVFMVNMVWCKSWGGCFRLWPRIGILAPVVLQMNPVDFWRATCNLASRSRPYYIGDGGSSHLDGNPWNGLLKPLRNWVDELSLWENNGSLKV